jgi:MFS family permease
MIRRNIYLIVFARGISDFGSFLNMIALSTYIYMIFHSTFMLSVFLASRVSGGIIASIIGTKYFRRFYGRYSLIIFDLLRAVLLTFILITPENIQYYVLLFIGFGIGFSNSMFSIGINSQIPYLVKAKHMITANSWLASISATSSVIGSLASGLIVANYGYKLVFVINIITYLIAATMLLPLKFVIPINDQTNQSKTNDSGTFKFLKNSLKNHKILTVMLVVSLTDTLASAAHNVGFPILSELITPNATSKTMGIILATWAIGKFTGAKITNTLLSNNQRFLNIERLFLIGVFLMSSSFIILFSQTKISFLIIFAILAGIGDGIAEVSLISRVQIEPSNIRLPFFSLLTLMQMTGFGIGMLLVAPFFGWFSPSFVVLLFHSIPLLMITIVFASCKIRCDKK